MIDSATELTEEVKKHAKQRDIVISIIKKMETLLNLVEFEFSCQIEEDDEGLEHWLKWDIPHNSKETQKRLLYFQVNKNKNSLSLEDPVVQLDMGTQVWILANNRLGRFARSLTQELKTTREITEKVLKEIREEQHENIDEILNSKVSVLDVNMRAFHCFDLLGIEYIHQLINKTEEDLLSLKNFGRHTLNQTKEALKSYNLSLKK